jgi:hypothetical protein
MSSSCIIGGILTEKVIWGSAFRSIFGGSASFYMILPFKNDGRVVERHQGHFHKFAILMLKLNIGARSLEVADVRL